MSDPVEQANDTAPEQVAHLGFQNVLCAVTALAALILVIIHIHTNGFWLDELYTLHSIDLSWTDMVFERLHRGHFPAYFAMVRLWYHLFPPDAIETALRSFSILWWVGAVVAFWKLSRQTLPGSSAILAVTMFACNQMGIRQASEARMYTVVLVIAVAVTWCFLKLQKPEKLNRMLWLMAALGVAGFAVSATIGLLIGSFLLVSIPGRRTNPMVLKACIISLVAGLIVFIPGAILHVATGDRLGIASSKPLIFLAHPVALVPGIQLWDDYFKTDSRLGVLLAIGSIITIAAIAILVIDWKSAPREIRLLTWATSLPLLLGLATWLVSDWTKFSLLGPPRYFITLMPSACLVAGWALASRIPPLTAQVVLSVFGLIAVYVMLTIQVQPFRKRIELLKKEYSAGDAVVVVPHEIADGTQFYTGIPVDLAINRWEMDRNKLARELAPLSTHKHVFIVWYHGNDSPAVDVAQSLWGNMESNNTAKAMGSLRVLKFTPAK